MRFVEDVRNGNTELEPQIPQPNHLLQFICPSQPYSVLKAIL